MAADDVRREAFLFELLAELCAGFSAYGFRFGVENEWVGVLAISSFWLVDVMVIALCFGNAAFAHAHRHHNVARLLEQLTADMNVLARKGLVNKEDIHAVVLMR